MEKAKIKLERDRRIKKKKLGERVLRTDGYTANSPPREGRERGGGDSRTSDVGNGDG